MFDMTTRYMKGIPFAFAGHKIRYRGIRFVSCAIAYGMKVTRNANTGHRNLC